MDLKSDPATKSISIYFETYFNYLGTFAFDKAKEFAETKKEQQVPSPLQVALVTFSQNEKSYYSLTFLQQKWFGKREFLRIAYVNLKENFMTIHKHEDRESSTEATKSDDLHSTVSQMCLQLAEFCALRAECINFYMQISKSLSVDSINDLLKEAENYISSFSNQIELVDLEILKERSVEEFTFLTLLFKTCCNLSNWEYTNAVCHLQELSFLLSKWKPMVAKNQSNSTFRSSFFGFGDRSQQSSVSALCDWFDKFFHFLVAKFSFYFHEALSRETSADEMKSYSSKTSFDFAAKLQNFIRKSDAKTVYLFLDVSDTKRIPKHGYYFDEALDEAEKLADDFFPALCLPRTNIGDVDQVTSLLRPKITELQLDKVMQQQNAEKDNTIFCIQLESRMYLVVHYTDRKHERDASASPFLNDIAQQVKLKKIGLLFKPGGR